MLRPIKNIVKKLPIAFTRNQQYDKQTRQVIRKLCSTGSNCIDIGCHKGEVLDLILEAAPKGYHYGFEPIPDMYKALLEKYANTSCKIFDIALSNEKGATQFNYVISNPAYSGLRKRNYDRSKESDTQITVNTDKLDNIIPSSVKISLIKIDVEGGELGVLEGARELLKRDRPVLIFEHGLGASEFYGAGPEKIFDLLSSCGLKISLMKNWLNNDPALDLRSFSDQFYQKKNYYFIAYP